jgi:predicted small secreted protein
MTRYPRKVDGNQPERRYVSPSMDRWARKGAAGFMRQAFVLAALCVAVTSLAGCNTGNGGPVGQGNYGTVFGTVTDSVTGKPISGASVVISIVVGTHTDASGAYRFTGVPLDSTGIDESIVASNPGYQNQTKTVHVAAAGQQYEVDFQLVATH